MDQTILDFINSQRVGILAVKMLDGSPHGAVIHFAYTDDPLTFIFMTSPTYKKVEPLRYGETAATLVIGTDEDTMKTMQLDGIAKLVDDDRFRRIYFEKFPEKLDKFPDNIFFIFSPTWWRFTDWKTPEGKRVVESAQ